MGKGVGQEVVGLEQVLEMVGLGHTRGVLVSSGSVGVVVLGVGTELGWVEVGVHDDGSGVWLGQTRDCSSSLNLMRKGLLGKSL